MASICSLSDLYKQSTELKKGEGQPADETVFLSQMDLKGFHEVERKYSQELTKLTKKLFFEVMYKHYILLFLLTKRIKNHVKSL